MDIHASLIEMITESDRAGANRLVEEWMVEHGHERLVVDVLGPVLKLVGEKWQEKEELSLAHAYVALRSPNMLCTSLASASASRGLRQMAKDLWCSAISKTISTGWGVA